MRSKLIVAAVALLLASPLVVLLAGPPWAEARASAAWRAAGWPLEGYAERHPKSRMNGTAEALVRMGRPLGLHFGRDLPAPATAAQQAFAAVAKDLRRHVEALTIGRPSMPSEALDAFRDRHARELTSLLTLLAESPPPAWDLDVAQGLKAPVPPAGAHRDLGAFLVLAALEPRAGDPAPETALRALVRLGAGLRGRPELISLLMSASLDRRTLALARQLEMASPALLDELGRDRKPALVPALQGEAFQLQSFVARDGHLDAASQGPKAVPRASAPFVRAYLRLCAAEYSRLLAGVADRLVRAPAGQPPAVPVEQDRASLGRWNVLGRAALTDFNGVGRALRLYALDAELTDKVLALRASRARGRLAGAAGRRRLARLPRRLVDVRAPRRRGYLPGLGRAARARRGRRAALRSPLTAGAALPDGARPSTRAWQAPPGRGQEAPSRGRGARRAPERSLGCAPL